MSWADQALTEGGTLRAQNLGAAQIARQSPAAKGMVGLIRSLSTN